MELLRKLKEIDGGFVDSDGAFQANSIQVTITDEVVQWYCEIIRR